DFSEKSILENLPYVLPPKMAAVRVFENVAKSPTAMESLARLKSDGYLLAVHGFSDPNATRLYELADIISMNVEDDDPASAATRVNATGRRGGSLLAMRIPNESQFKACLELGFALFHGAFFKSPDHVSVRKLTSNE